MEHTPTLTLTAILSGGKESILSKFAAESVGPFRSFFWYTAHKISGGKVRPELSQYFRAHTPETQPEVEISQAYDIIRAIDTNLLGEAGVPEHFIGGDYHRWLALQTKINALLGPGTALTDYVMVDRDDQCAYLFATKGQSCIPIKILPERMNIQQNEIPLPHNDDVTMELMLNNFARTNTMEPGHYTVWRLNSITNNFSCQRHVLFEREGAMFTQLRQKGAWSIGELQDVHRTLFSRGAYYDSQRDEVVIDPDLADMWMKIRTVCLGSDTEAARAQAMSEMHQYARESLCFEMALQYFRENPHITDAFLNASAYRLCAMDFTDKNLSALGLTERGRAENMLANMYLLYFEGGGITHSPSQVYLARIPRFHTAVEAFIRRNNLQPPADGSLRSLFHLLKEKTYPFTRSRVTPQHKAETVAKGRKSLPNVMHQIERNTFNQAVLEKMGQHAVPVLEKGIFATVIANIGLAQVPGQKRFTESTWFPSAPGYLPEGKPLPPVIALELPPAKKRVVDALRYIFNGDIPQGFTAYDAQEKRMFNADLCFFHTYKTISRYRKMCAFSCAR